MRHAPRITGTGGRAVRRAVAGLVALGLAAWSGLRSGSAQQGGLGAPGSSCRIASVAQTDLRAGNGDRVYVEASSLTVSGGDLLLAGTPNYVMRFSVGSTLPSEVVSNGVFGVIVRRDGSVVPVSAPRDGSRIGGIRTAPRAAGGWHVVFSEAERLNRDGFPDPGARIWYGLLADGAWRRLEALPLPAGHEVAPLSISSLVALGDSLAVAAIVQGPGGRKAVAAFTLRSGRWEASVSRRNAAYVEAVWQAGGEPRVAVVEADESLPYDVNSLLLYAFGPEWRRVRRVAGGAGAPAHAPRFQPGAGGYLGGLVGRRQEMGDRNDATLWPLDEALPALVLDTSAARLATHAVGGSRLIAVVEHLMEDDLSRELRLYRAGPEGVSRIGSLPYPYAGYSASTFLPPDEIVIAGPVRVPIGGGEMVVSRLLRTRLACGEP